MVKSYKQTLDEIYGLPLLTSGDEIPSRHFGYYPSGDADVEMSVAQKRYIKEVTKYIKKGSYVLDIGCAFGETAVWLAQNLDCRVLGIDIVELQTDKATEFAKQLGLEDKLEFKCLDAGEISFEPNTFDYVISLGVLVHVPAKDKVFQNAYQALKPGGGIAFSDPIRGESCRWFAKKMSKVVTFNVSFMNTVKQYFELLENTGFTNASNLDVTKTAFIKTWDLSRKEGYKTVGAPFMQGGGLMATAMALNFVRMLAMPGLKRGDWGWHFFWADKK